MSSYRTAPQDRTGMPPGIPYIIGNELAERFSFYGMKGILTVFMTKHLMDSSGALDTMGEEEAKAIYHLFTGAAYFFPLFGSLLSDIFLGKYRTILLLSMGYCIGHALLAMGDTGLGRGILEPRMWMFLGLGFIAVGAGGIKPCVSAHVGDQFGENNKHLISKIFNWFYFSINAGSFVATILIPVILKQYGPALAFGLPGILMAIATFVFWLGRNNFVHIPASGPTKFLQETFSPAGRRALINLAPIFLIFIPMFWALFDQTGSAWVLQADKMDRTFLGIEWLPSQIQALNPLFILILIPVFTYILYPMINSVVKLTPLRKIGIGMFITVAAFAVSGLIETRINGGDGETGARATTAERWTIESMLDGPADGYGWSSGVLGGATGLAELDAARVAAAAFQDDDDSKEASAARNAVDNLESSTLPIDIDIRLRERKGWTIDAVALNPWSIRGTPEESNEDAYEAYDELDKAGKQAWEDEPQPQNAARTVTVLVRNADTEADTSNPQWTEVGRIELAATDDLQRLGFDAVPATHVRFRIESNHGGDRVRLGEVQVLAAGAGAPDGSSPDAAEVWPDVAAIGHQPNLGWQFLAYILLTAAEVMVSITSLEFAYTQAPKKMKSFIMGVYFLGVSLGNFFTSAVNFFIQNDDGTSKLAGASYYWFFTGLMLATSILFIFMAMAYRGTTFIQGKEDALPDNEANVEGTTGA
ncbi:MAG: hypothetical protein AB8G96_00830 [Phycisphaerales bacterium]